MTERPPTIAQRVAAYGVHLYTAIGAICAFKTLTSIVAENEREAFLWMTIAVVVDATDGSLARKLRVREFAPEVDGRKIDDLVDFLNFTFVPCFMLHHLLWLPEPTWLLCAFPMVASLFGFAHLGAKEEDNGFFRGFPSYWNIVVFYFGVFGGSSNNAYVLLGIVLILSLLTVLPVRFVYPNRPPCWPLLFHGGSYAWLGFVVAMLWQYPDIPIWLSLMSLVYPVFYTVSSIALDVHYGRAQNSKAQ